MGKICALCLSCNWDGPIADLKKVPVRNSTITFLHCPKCDGEDFELYETEDST